MASINDNKAQQARATPKDIARKIGRLRKVPASKLDNAICDIIDLRGYALAVVLKKLPNLPAGLQKQISIRIEDLIFFHPSRGERVYQRLLKAVTLCAGDCRCHLIAAISDVLEKTKKNLPVPREICEIARSLLITDVDSMRKGKAVEILSMAEVVSSVPGILVALIENVEKIENYENFCFTETALFALKKLGGEGLLRLLVNPQSAHALAEFRVEWRNRSPESAQEILKILRQQDEDFVQKILKVIDLSEFGLPFISMISEGLGHSDKWVRHNATASLARIVDGKGLKHLRRMLKDPALEVRMIAINSLGNFPIAMSGKILTEIAQNEGENADSRMNALYSLFSQKNLNALEKIGKATTGSMSMNAQGLEALLRPKDEALERLLLLLEKTPVALMHELFHYLMEVSRPEDLKHFVRLHSKLSSQMHRDSFLTFISAFLTNKAGVTLDRAMNELSPAEQVALKALQS